MNYLKLVLPLMVTIFSHSALSVDSDFKEYPIDRFAIYTGDGNYKQAYRWSFNEQGQGQPIVVLLNHGSGGEWYRELSTLGPCATDHTTASGDYSGGNYDGLCTADDDGNRIYLADFNHYHVPIGIELDKFMKRRIVGSSAFAAWYWQDAFRQFDSPVHIFMVGRYNIAKSPDHLNNALFWLHETDASILSRNSLPPFNFGAAGLKNVDGDDRPFHTAPDISAFDNFFLLKALKEKFPQIDQSKVIVEGRSNGGSAMVMLAADYEIWPEHVRDFWSRNLPAVSLPPAVSQPEPQVTLTDIMQDPILEAAFDTMLAGLSKSDLLNEINAGSSLQIFANFTLIQGSAGQETLPSSPDQDPIGYFDPSLFQQQLSAYVGSDPYSTIMLVHALYPGCRLDGYMGKDNQIHNEQTVTVDGHTRSGYRVALKTLFSFAEKDSLYTHWCDDRVAEASAQSSRAGHFLMTDWIHSPSAVHGELYQSVGHGFEYKDVHRNLPSYNSSENFRAAEARRAIEKAINTAFSEASLSGSYQLPYDLK